MRWVCNASVAPLTLWLYVLSATYWSTWHGGTLASEGGAEDQWFVISLGVITQNALGSLTGLQDVVIAWLRKKKIQGRKNWTHRIRRAIPMLLYRCGPLRWLHERRSGRWNKAARLGTVASVGWLNQAIKKASLTNAVLPPRSAFHQPQGRMKYASAEGNVPYLCPGGDKFIAHSAIYNPSEPRRSGSRYLIRAGVAPSTVAPAWRVSQWAAVRAEKGGQWQYF